MRVQGPAGQQVQCVLRAGTLWCVVDDNALASGSGEVEGFVVQLQVAGDRVPEALGPEGAFVNPVLTRLVLQRQLGECVAASSVVAEACLVLAFSAPVGPVPDVFGGVGVLEREVDEQTADLR